MRLTEDSRLTRVAAAVADALTKGGIRAVLTGGACASIYSRGGYQSADLDFILQEGVPQDRLDSAMATVGFRRRGDRYIHPRARYYVEFPRGPLAVGGEDRIRPVEKRLGSVRIQALSASDSCRDRLSHFFHWRDQQSLRTAVTIALRNPVDLKEIRAWSLREGFPEGFETFRKALETARKRSKARASR